MQEQSEAQTESAKDVRIAALEAELAEARRQQEATTDVLKTISESGANLQVVLDRLVRTTSALCDDEDVAIHRLEGEVITIAAHFGSIPIPPGAYPVSATGAAARAIRERTRIEVDDLPSETEQYPGGSARARTTGARTFLCVPLVNGDRALGAIVLRRLEVKRFSDNQIALVEAFASQAVIAIENARLFETEQARSRELQEALEYQRGGAEVLQAIAGSPGRI
ncbi:MAG TPA: GAF domain-containing protein, partial [Hyphomicrobiaceae bacterium]|nr:GAF domain-containing protein [Hyphomicrobiaceae bacterium]